MIRASCFLRLSAALALLISLFALAGCVGMPSSGAAVPGQAAGKASAGTAATGTVPAGTSAAVSDAVASPYPAERPARFKQISIAEGLSQSVVNDTVQDRRGFLWFATQDGLNRFDGYSFTVYKNDTGGPDSLSHTFFTSVIEDRQGYLWVGTLSGGLNRFDPATGRAQHYLTSDLDPNALSDNRVTSILEDHEGTIWVGTSQGGLNRYDPQKDGFLHYRSQPDDRQSLSNDNIAALYETQDGTLWVGTRKGGLNRFDRLTGTFTQYLHEQGNQNSLAGDTALSLAEDALGRLWIGTNNGLDSFDLKTGSFTHHWSDSGDPRSTGGAQVATLHADRAGVLWAGVTGSGLCRLETGNRQDSAPKKSEDQFTCFQHDLTKSDSLSANDVLDIYEDREGILWVGTYGGGVSRLDPGYKRFETIASSPPGPKSLAGDLVFAVTQDPQRMLWVGMNGSGLDRVDRRTGLITHFGYNPKIAGSLSSDRVYAVFRDHTGTIWVGTWMGLDRFNPSDGTFTHFIFTSSTSASQGVSNVMAIAEDGQGNLWLGSGGGGINRFDRATGTFTRYLNKPGDMNSLASNSVITLYFDSTGMLWIGTQNRGLDRFDLRTETFTHFPNRPNDPKSLSENYVLGIHEDRAGTLWVATGAGLNQMDRLAGTFQAYRVKDGLPNNCIYQILEDQQGRLWLSTNTGISRFDPKSRTFKNFVVADGLLSNEFNMGAAYQSADGEMFFGGVGGVTMFYPENIQDNPYIPPVVLTSLTQHGERLADGGAPVPEITVRWPDNYFDFEFAALNYIRPENNQYAYRLDGFDRDWNMIGTKRSGRYTNLPGGAYTLQIKGSNNDGLWNETGTAIRVLVVPPFWATWWFRGVVALLVVSTVAGGVRLRVRSVESRNQELERLVQARTSEIQKLYEQTKELAVIEERNRLARDLHDSAKQKAFAALAQLGAANGLVRSNPSRAYTALREAETLVYEVIEELTFLIQEMYPAALKEKGLATVLREYIFEWESRNDIPVDYRIENECPLPLKIEQALYRIIQEALANISRHSQARQVKIMVEYTPDQVNISISDDGQGFDMSRRPAGVGLRSMEERISMIGGRLMIESSPGQGTHLVACAPIPDDTGREASQ